MHIFMPILILIFILGSCSKETFPVEYDKLIHNFSDNKHWIVPRQLIVLEDGLYILNYSDIKLNEGDSFTSKYITTFMPVSAQFTEGSRAWFDMQISGTDFKISTDEFTIFKNINNEGPHYNCSVLLLTNPRTGDGYKVVNLYVSNYIAVKEFKPTEIVFYVNGHLLSEKEIPTYKKLRKQDLRHIKVNHDPQTGRVDVYVTTTSKIY